MKKTAFILLIIALLLISSCSAQEDGSGEGGKEAEALAAEEASKSPVDEPESEASPQTSAMVPVETEEPEASEPDEGSEEPGTEAADEPEEASENEAAGEGGDTEEDNGEDESPESPESPSEEEDTVEGTFTSEPIPDEVFARMQGVSYPEGCPIARDDLRYLRLSYHDFSGQTRVGELVCHRKLAGDMTEIFKELYKRGYQIDKMRLIDDYGGDDDLSCADNNTSCFNYRTVAGSNSLSKHAMGAAIDINPFYNPYVTYPNGVERISPPGSEPYAVRSSDFPHKIGPGDDAYELFKAHGFTWGGNWKSLKDYQHFQKGV